MSKLAQMESLERNRINNFQHSHERRTKQSLIWNFIGGFVNIVYPKTCVICKVKLTTQADSNFICGKCWGTIKYNLPPFCNRCGRQLSNTSESKSVCTECLKRNLHFDRAFSPCIYDGTVKTLIHEFKYNGKDYLGALLSKPMIEFIREYNVPMEHIDIIMPIPLYASRLRERGFNQAAVLSNYLAEEFQKQVVSDNLIRNRATETQTDLEKIKRFENVSKSFSLNRSDMVKGKNILLVDDVLTTGATSSEAAYALKNAGADIVFVLTLAS